MKTTSFALLSLLAGLVAGTARAESRVYANIEIRPTPVAIAPVVAPVIPRYAPGHAAPRYNAPRGYWQDVTVRNWVPDRWIVMPGRHGRSVRVFEPGHFVYSTDRVWVDNRGGNHREGRMYGWNR